MSLRLIESFAEIGRTYQAEHFRLGGRLRVANSRRKFESSRPAFTLVELLVVIAIIGILVAMLLPAVQSARESARRANCSSNFKHVGLGLEMYHSQYRVFPPGMVEYYSWNSCPGNPSGTRFGFGWTVSIMPFLEYGNLYNSMDLSRNYSDVGAREHVGDSLPIFNCPSDANSGRMVECCSGWNNGPRLTDDVGSTNIAGVADSVDLYCGSSRAVRNDGNGMLMNVRALSSSHATDGASNTLMIGEVTGASGVHSTQGDAFMSYYWASWAVQDVAQGINGPGTVPGGRDQGLDPVDGDGGNRHDEMYDEVGFSSFHPGGAHFALVGGSVHFLSDNIDQSTLEGLATRAGGEAEFGGAQ